jgi:hypothetical protein
MAKFKAISRPYIRKALSRDKGTIFAFSQHTWYWGDYLQEIWEEWFHEQGSLTLVATIARVPVTTGHMSFPTPNEAWLEGLRVNPKYRHHGLARRITHRFIIEVGKRGVKVLRLATTSQTEAILKVMTHLKFKQVADFKLLQKDLHIRQDKKTGFKEPVFPPIDSILSYLLRSPVMKAQHSLINKRWRFLNLIEEEIRGKLIRCEIRAISDNHDIKSLVFIESSPESLDISFADGQLGTLKDLICMVTTEALIYRKKRVTAKIPNLGYILDVFKETGFQPVDDLTFLIYEKRFKQ